MNQRLKDKKLFLLDMDGTIYLGDDLFDGTKDFLEHVKKSGGKYVFLTNNSSKGIEGYLKKMERLGIPAEAEDFLTSTDATIRYLKNHYSEDALFYVCGTENFKLQLRSAGLRIADEPLTGPCIDPARSSEFTAVVLAYDTELTYKKLEDCTVLLGDPKVDYIATHPDMVCPTTYGSAPDIGCYIEMLKTSAHRTPVVIGKPQPEMAYMAMEKFGCTPEQTCIMGDRLYTDIACGVNAGIDSIFVLSGEGTVADIEKFRITPAFIYDNIRKVLQDME